MSFGPIAVLKGALLDMIKADAGVTALLADRVFDEVPRDNAGQATVADDNGVSFTPYLYLGPVGWRRLEGGEAAGFTATLRLYVVSTDFGRDEAWSVAEAVRAACDLQNLGERLAPHGHTELRVMSSGDVVGPLEPKQVFLEIQTELFSASP